MISPFAKRVATTAEQQHARFQFMNEADPELCRQIQKWTEEIGFTFNSWTSVPWSAVFVSWCVKEADSAPRCSACRSTFCTIRLVRRS